MRLRGRFWWSAIPVAGMLLVAGAHGQTKKGREAALLDKLAAAAQQQRESAPHKQAGPAARWAVGRPAQAALLDKLAKTQAPRLSKEPGRPDRVAWLQKLQRLAQQQRVSAIAKPPQLFPARKPAAVQQLDEDAQQPVRLTYEVGELAGHLSPAGDTDTFVFSGDAGDAVDISARSGDFDTVVELEFGGQVIALNDDGGEGTDSLIEDFVLPQTGQYLVRVLAFDDSSIGAYSVALSKAAAPWTFQGQLEPGTVSGALDTGGDIHLYTFSLTESSQVWIDLQSDEFDAFLTLYAGQGVEDRTPQNQLAIDDDGGEGTNSRLEEQLSAGSYLVEVRAFSSESTGQYHLGLEVTGLGNDEDSGGGIALSYGQSLEGGIFPAGDVDEYVFTGSAGEVIDLSLESEDFDAYVELEFDGQVIAADDDGGEGFDSLIEDFVLPASGTYLARVHALGDQGTGYYTVSVSEAAAPWTFQGQLEPGTVSGALDTGGDIHLYTFAVGQLSQVQLDLSSDAFDTFLVLYAGQGVEDRTPQNQLAIDDDGGEGTNSRLEEQLSAGSYLVEVRAFSSESTGQYHLGLEVTGLGNDEDSGGGIALSYGQSLEGGIFPAGDVDEYVFTGSAGEVIDLSLESEDFDAYVELEFDGQVIAADDDGGEGFDSLIEDFVLPASGTYLARVHALGDQGTGYYTVGVENVTPPLIANGQIAQGTYSGQIAQSGELQIYAFSLSSPSQVQLDLQSDEFDAFLSLYAGQGAGDRLPENLLAQDDDSGEGVNARLLLPLPAGVYLVEARPLVSGTTGAYTLRLAVTAVEGDEDSGGPAALAYGQEQQGHLLPAGDVDRYAFSGAAGDVVDIALASPDFDTYAELVRNGEVIAADDDGGEDLNSLIDDFALPASGQYEVRVHSYGDAGAGAYTVSAQNASSQLLLNPPFASGTLAGEISRSVQVQVYPLRLAERAEVQIDLNSLQFPAILALYTGQGLADRLAANRVAEASDGQAVQILQELPAGNYLIEVRASTPAQTGAYELTLKTSPVRQARDRLTLLSGQLNGASVSPFAPLVRVEPGAKLSGTLVIEVENTHSRSEIFPVGLTPTWGDHQRSFREIEDWAAPGSTRYSASVDLVAPQTPGIYYLILAGAAEATVADLMSGTHFASQAAEIWDNGDDVASWSASQIGQAIQNGWVSVDWFSRYHVDIAAGAVRVEVAQPVAAAAGPVALDFDLAVGNQGTRRLEGGTSGQIVQVQLHVHEAPSINGWSAQIHYDPDQVRYVSGSFAPSDFIEGLVTLVVDEAGLVEVGGTVLGTGGGNSGDGLLGTVSFELLPGFAASTNLVVTQVSFRTTDSGRIKESTQAVGTIVAESRLPEGPITLDLDLAAGDQGARRQEGARAGQVLQMQLNVAGAPAMRGWSARIEFDPTQVRYVSSSFTPTEFIRGLVPLVGEKSGRVDLGGTILGSGAGSSGDGALGTLSFEILEGFSGNAELVITRISFNTVASGEVAQEVHAVVALSSAAVLPGDFDGNGAVEFSDFFLFADNFGKGAGDEGWDSRFDLSGNGEVDFSDFFLFADNFGREAQAKLLALAREYLGLPAGPRLDQNYPNPFNASTSIRYQVLEPSLVRLEVFALNGQRVRTLAEGFQEAGGYQLSWDGKGEDGEPASSGAYFLRLEAGPATQMRKMLLLK